MNEPSTMTDSNLDLRLTRLPREIQPARDLWPAIEAATSGRHRRDWRLGLGLAAGIAVLAISVFVALRPQAPLPATAAIPALMSDRDPASLRTRAALAQSFQAELAHLPKATQARLWQDLDLIRSARADIRRALDANPQSPLLRDLLADTWQQELDFYANVATTTDPVRMRWPL
jgi:hypothetical protein